MNEFVRKIISENQKDYIRVGYQSVHRFDRILVVREVLVGRWESGESWRPVTRSPRHPPDSIHGLKTHQRGNATGTCVTRPEAKDIVEVFADLAAQIWNISTWNVRVRRATSSTSFSENTLKPPAEKWSRSWQSSSETVDQQHALTLLRKIKQRPRELVLLFMERLLTLSEDAFDRDGAGALGMGAQQRLVA